MASSEDAADVEQSLADRFNQVLANIEAEIANIAPAAQAERLRLAQRAQLNVGVDASPGQRGHYSDNEVQSDITIFEWMKAEDGNKEAAIVKNYRPTLVGLPCDVRLKILDFAIKPVDRPVPPVALFRDLLPAPPVARVGNRRVSLESFLVLIRKSELIINGTKPRKHLEDWLSRLDFTILGEDTDYVNGFDAVKTLTFKFFKYEDEYVPQYSSPMLVARCTNIEAAEIRIAKSSLVHCIQTDTGDPTCVPTPVRTISDGYGLRSLLFLTKLKRLSIQVDTEMILEKKSGRKKLNNLTESVDDSLKALQAWLEGEFNERGRLVHVIIPARGKYKSPHWSGWYKVT